MNGYDDEEENNNQINEIKTVFYVPQIWIQLQGKKHLINWETMETKAHLPQRILLDLQETTDIKGYGFGVIARAKKRNSLIK